MSNIFQSKEWAEFKESTGYDASFFIDDILVLKRKLPLGWSMLYSPMVSKEKVEGRKWKGFLDQIKEKVREHNAIFYRLELDVPSALYTLPSTLGFVKSFEEMQPEHTLILDITKSEEEILAQMKQKGRYNIKIAERNGIVVEKAEPAEGVDIFYKLYSDTGKRHKITYRGKKYFDGLLEILSKSGYACVYVAYSQIERKKTPLAAAIIIYSGKTAIYMFGASSDEYKNMMAPYKLHWEIIKEAKEAGFKTYDFFGIAPDDNPKHAWAGVTRFKRQFGGQEIDTLGSFDLILNSLKYTLFKIAEKVRR